ncbi:MAG TPA: NIPSNAP family protein [Gemmataceae bacterium]|nr:NIPSNAP family protein [Gemmataceae bacterium]
MSCCMLDKLGGGRMWILAGVLTVALAGGLAVLAVRAANADKGDKSVEQRVYELRTYNIAPGKADALHARFRDHTLKIFEKHGMKVEGFWKPLDDKAAEETLVYLLSFPSKDAADKAWKDFGADPEWKQVKNDSEKDGKLVTNVDSVFLTPTDYAPSK